MFCGVSDQLMDHHCHRRSGLWPQDHFGAVDLNIVACCVGCQLRWSSDASGTPCHWRSLKSSCVDAIDLSRPSSATTKCAIELLASNVCPATALTVARTFLTRWSSSATNTRWCSSARLRSVTSMLTPTALCRHPSELYEMKLRDSIHRTSPSERTMRYSMSYSPRCSRKAWLRASSIRARSSGCTRARHSLRVVSAVPSFKPWRAA